MAGRIPARTRARRPGGAAVLGIAAVAGGLAWGVAQLPASTRQGVGYRVSTQRIPLATKALGFLHRDAQYRLLARQVTQGAISERDRVLALFEWTRRAIRKPPRGWPVIDDHILHIIIRGYGQGDQMADVFTTLATYAGVPAFWRPGSVALSFARIDGRWAVFDVAGGVVFTDARGQWYDVAQLLAHPELVEQVAGQVAPAGAPTQQYVDALRGFHVPPVLRARLQMPLPRLAYEARRAFGLLPSHPAQPAEAAP